MDKNEVLKLAKLARIEIGDEEAESLTQEIGSILNYISEIKSADVSGVEVKAEDFILKNVFREDINPHENGAFAKELMKEVPKKEGNYVKVKKIF